MHLTSRRTRWNCDRCGHAADSHEHYHGGDYCGVSNCYCNAYHRKWRHIVMDWVSR